MLILFVATKGGSESAPTLRDLHVMDSENSTHVPVAGMDGWDDDFLQVQTLTFAPCELSSEAAFTSGTLGDTDMFWCRRLFKGLIHASFSDSGATATIRVLWYDKNDVETVGAIVTLTAGTRQDGSSYYMAPVHEFELNGANKCAIEVVTVSAGTVNIRQAGV